MAEAPRPVDTPSPVLRDEHEAAPAPTGAAVDLREHLRGLYGLARAEALGGVAIVRAARLEPPARHARLRRFGYGLALPAALARIVLADRALRRRYLRIVGAQFAVTLIVAVAVVWMSLSIDDDDLSLARQAAFWSSIYAILCAVEWIVFALSRDYHAVLARELCLAAGIPPEDEEIKPAIRLNFRWLYRKLRARARGFLVFASILPLAGLLSEIVGRAGQAVSAVLLAAWSVYWAGVFVAAKTAYSWANEETAPAPIYLRTWRQASGDLPGVIRWIPDLYGKLWDKLTRSLFAPASRFEASPYELTGLALFRLVRYVPGLYILFRPLFGVSAAHIVLLEKQAPPKALGDGAADAA